MKPFSKYNFLGALLVLLGIVIIIVTIIEIYKKSQSPKKLTSLGFTDSGILMNYNYEKNTPVNDTCVFERPFTNIPCLFGSVVNLNNGSHLFTNSIMSFSNITPSTFVPQIFQTWPTMGINWMALEEISIPNLEIGKITSPQDLVYPDPDFNKNYIPFKTSFDSTPVVIISQISDGNYAQNREFGVYNVSPNGFFVTWYDSFDYADSWPSTLCYLAINPESDMSKLFDSTEFVVECGSIISPSFDGWDGGIKLQKPRQFQPIIIATMGFNGDYQHSYQKNSHMNITIDTISRNSFHVNSNRNDNNNWMVNWIAISRSEPTTSSEFPIQLKSYYQKSKPRGTTKDKSFFFVDTVPAISNPLETTILANPIDIIKSNSVGRPSPNMVHVYDISQDGFVIKINEDNKWPDETGIQYSIFERNPQSNIDNHVIDQGVFLPENVNYDLNYIQINFNFEFKNVPKIFTNYNFVMDYPREARTAIVKVTKTYFILQFAGFQYWNTKYTFKSPIHWVAIDNMETWSQSSPFTFEIGSVNSFDELISDKYAYTNNPRLEKVFGFFDIDTKKFPTPPIIHLNINVVNIDSIYKDFFHINTPIAVMTEFSELYPFYWLMVRPISQPVQPRMEFIECDVTTFIEPGCPTIDTDPNKCGKIIVEYLPKLKHDYFPLETELEPSDESEKPIDFDGIVLCNIYLNKAKLTASSDFGCICECSANHLINSGSEIGGYTQWLVNADYGYFSNCKSIGNVLIRINSDFSSTNPVNLEFYGLGYCPTFQYYVQWGTSYDEIKGPFAYNERVEFTFGKEACDEFDVYCNLKRDMEGICEHIVGPIVNLPYDWTKASTCAYITPEILAACIGLSGGPADIIGDAMCVGIAAILTDNCKELINDGTDAEGIGKNEFTKKICEAI